VELTVNGKKLGRQTMPRNGHLKWKAVYQPGKVVAIGYKNGKRILTETVETTRPASRIVLKADRQTMKADGRDVSVVTVEVQDNKGRIVPNACPMLTFRLEGEGRIIGVGNGDPAYLGEDHPKDKDCHEFGIPAFNGLAQILIQSSQIPSALTLSCTADGLKQGFLSLTTANRGE
jgi:beta-galactosidase